MGKKNNGLVHNSFPTADALGVATHYIEIPVLEGSMGIHIRWADATSSAAITLESTNEPQAKVAATSTTAGDWCTESGVSITGPTAAAAGASMTHIGNVGSERLRLKVIAAAVTKLQVRVNGKVN